MAKVEKSFADVMAFGRASEATYIDATGTVRIAAANEPRIDFHPTTKVSRGILLEEARTNLAINSATPSAQLGVSIDPAAADRKSPTGNADALFVRETDVTNEHFINDYVFSAVSGTYYTISVFTKAGAQNNRNMRLRFAGITEKVIDFNPAAKTFTVTAGATGGFEEYPNGWFRVWLTWQANVAGTLYCRWQLMQTASPNTANYTGNVNTGIYMWGKQVEVGRYPTSYIVTGANAVTRSADLCQMNSLVPFLAPYTGTFVAEFASKGVTGSYVGPFAMYSPTNEVIRVIQNDTTMGINAESYDNTVRLYNTPVVGYTANEFVKFAFAYDYKSAAYKFSKDAAIAERTAPKSVAGSYVLIGRYIPTTTPSGSFWVRNFKYFPRKLSNAEINQQVPTV